MKAPKILLDQLQLNSNSPIYKDVLPLQSQVIRQKVYSVEEVAYLYFTSTHQHQYLQQYCNLQVDQSSILKKRIQQITDDALAEVLLQIETKSKKQHDQQNLSNFTTRINIQQLVKEYPDSIKDYFSANHPKTKQVKQKLKMINEDVNKFRERISSLKKKNQEKKLQEIQMKQQLQKNIEIQKKQKYKSQVLKKLQQTKTKQQERSLQHKKFKQFLRQFKSSKPLHVLMEEQYLLKYQLPTIQQRNRKYQEKKINAKPTLQEINNHQKQYLTKKINRPQPNVLMHQTIDVPYKSKFYMDEQRKHKNSDSDDDSQNYDFNERRRRYSELVKQKFRPRLKLNTQQKQHQEEQKQKDNHKGYMEVPDRSRHIQVGKKYLQYVRSLDKKHPLNSSQLQVRQDKTRQASKVSPRYINYLEDLKTKHNSMNNASGFNWQIDLRDKKSSAIQRRDRVLMKSKQLQQRAFRKQQYLSLYNHVKAEDALQKKKQIDQTLIESIRAKVAVLKDVHGFK